MIFLRHLLVVLPLFLVVTVSTSNAGYVRPTTDVAYFERELLTLDVDQRSQVARELSALTRNFPGSAAESPGVRARAMAVALMLDPTNRDAVTTNGMFGNGLASTSIDGFKNYELLVRNFQRLTRFLNGEDANEEDKRLGLMMMDLVWRLDPQSGMGQSYSEILDRGEGMDWSDFISPDVDRAEKTEGEKDSGEDPFGYLREEEEQAGEPEDDEPEEPGASDVEPGDGESEKEPAEWLKNEKLIAGDKPLRGNVQVTTMVSPPAMGYMSALAYLEMRVTSSRSSREWVDGELKDLDRPVAAEDGFLPHPVGLLANSEVYRSRVRDGMQNLRNDYEGWPKGCVAEVSCPQYGGVSGSLGALATLVGVDALVRDLEIDPGVVVLGSFVPESDQLTDHVELAPALLRLDKRNHGSVKRVIVPAGEADLYCNLLAAVGGEVALRFQIIAVSSVREASELARVSVAPRYQEAIAEFEKIQELQWSFDELVRNPHVRAKLESIVEKLPQHVSARALLKAGGMSPYGSATLSENDSVAVLGAMIRPFAHMLEYKFDAIPPSEAKSECEKFLVRLSKARRNVNQNMGGIVLRSEEFVSEMNGYLSRNNKTNNSALQQFEAAKVKFQELEAQFGKFNAELRW